MLPRTVLICLCIILFFIIVEYLRHLPNMTKMYLKSEFRGRQLANRKLFADFLKRFNKSYGVEEHHKRFRYFKKNLKKADRLNDGINHAWFGVTKFSDWSEKELSQLLTPSLGGGCEPKENVCKTELVIDKRRDYRRAKYEYLRYGRVLGDGGEVPSRWDWREHNAVTPVFDQKICQICWAASIAGVMESMAAIHGLGLTILSKQQLMDCIYDNEEPKMRCIKGRPLVEVFQSMCSIQHTHLATEAEYPLTFADEECRNIRGARSLKRYENRCSMNEEELVKVLARGPVTALVDARLFFNYISGVISHNCQISEEKLNHAVQIVGYDNTTQPPHYIVRNSWGEDWGERGYARLAIGGNQCGIAYSVGILDVY